MQSSEKNPQPGRHQPVAVDDLLISTALEKLLARAGAQAVHTLLIMCKMAE
jgi:hypothetical protein